MPALDHRLPLVLVHGGLYDDITADEFWTASGVTPGLDAHIVTYACPDRPRHPSSWHDEAVALAAAIEARGWAEVAVVAASNGCSAAVRLAVDRPDLVARLLLAWPATAGESVADALAATMIDEVGPPGAAARLLAGDTLRGVDDAEIAALAVPVAIWPSVPENQFHQGRTVMSLLQLLAEPILVGGSPEPGHKAFGPFLERFVDVLVEVSIVDADDVAPPMP